MTQLPAIRGSLAKAAFCLAVVAMPSGCSAFANQAGEGLVGILQGDEVCAWLAPGADAPAGRADRISFALINEYGVSGPPWEIRSSASGKVLAVEGDSVQVEGTYDPGPLSGSRYGDVACRIDGSAPFYIESVSRGDGGGG